MNPLLILFFLLPIIWNVVLIFRQNSSRTMRMSAFVCQWLVILFVVLVFYDLRNSMDRRAIGVIIDDVIKLEESSQSDLVVEAFRKTQARMERDRLSSFAALGALATELGKHSDRLNDDIDEHHQPIENDAPPLNTDGG